MKKILLLLFSFTTTFAFCQPDFRFHQYSIEDGLPSPHINDIAEDIYGFIWFGTGEGLARYNGYNFKVFRNVNGSHRELISNSITSIYPLPNGDLLIGTSTGLRFFDHKKQLFKNIWGNLPPSYISKIVSDLKNGFWIGSSTGLYHLASITDTPNVFIEDEKSSLYQTSLFDIHLLLRRVSARDSALLFSPCFTWLIFCSVWCFTGYN